MIKLIKQFLKPSLGKIILTIIFGLAAYYFGINPCVTPPSSQGMYWERCHYVVLSPVFWGPAFLSPLHDITITLGPIFSFPSHIDSYISAQLSLGQLFFAIIYWYLIASVIVYIYSIIRNEFIRKNHSEN